MVSRRNAIFWRMLCAVVTVCLVVTLTPSLGNNSNTGQGANEVYAASAAWDGSYDTSWYNTTDTSFEINTPAQLAGLSALVSGIDVVNGKLDPKTRVAAEDFAGKTITLTADLDMGGVYNESTETWSGPTWVPSPATPISETIYPLAYENLTDSGKALVITGGTTAAPTGYVTGYDPAGYPTGTASNQQRNYRYTLTTYSDSGTYIQYTDGSWAGPQWWVRNV